MAVALARLARPALVGKRRQTSRDPATARAPQHKVAV